MSLEYKEMKDEENGKQMPKEVKEVGREEYLYPRSARVVTGATIFASTLLLIFMGFMIIDTTLFEGVHYCKLDPGAGCCYAFRKKQECDGSKTVPCAIRTGKATVFQIQGALVNDELYVTWHYSNGTSEWRNIADIWKEYHSKYPIISLGDSKPVLGSVYLSYSVSSNDYEYN